MKNTITKREKIMIFVATVTCAIFLCGNFAIIPMSEHYDALVIEYDNLLTEKAILDMKLADEPLIKDSNAKAILKYDEMKLIYPFAIPNEELDNKLTGLCLENGLIPKSLTMSAPVFNKNDESQEDLPPIYSVVSATMTVTGSYASFQKFLNAVDEISYVRISNASYAEPQNNSDSDPTITLAFEITMLNYLQ